MLDEATSLIDPRAARHLERSLAAVLEGRTVIAIAHRLFSAHDADRVAVVEDGRITELGSHDELVAAGGSYAALWESWHGTPAELTCAQTVAIVGLDRASVSRTRSSRRQLDLEAAPAAGDEDRRPAPRRTRRRSSVAGVCAARTG